MTLSFFFFSSRRRHTRYWRDWSSDVCSSDLRLHGVITPTPSPVARNAINLHAVESALTRAFDHDRLVAVALVINSPGGRSEERRGGEECRSRWSAYH